MHTYGGSVFDGNLIFNAINASKKNIQIDIMGIAASMGAIISQSRTGTKPRMVRNGFLMIHAPSGGSYGTAKDHENTAKLLNSIESQFITMLSSTTGLAESKVSKWMVGDNWFDAQEALDLGLISEIIEPVTQTINNDLNPKELGMQGMYYQYTALLTGSNHKNLNSDHTMKKPIIEALSLQGVTEQSSDTAVIEAVKKHFETKELELQGKLDAEIRKRTDLEAQFNSEKKASIDAEIANAVTSGKITAAQKETYEKIAQNSGLETLKTVLAAIPARNPITNQIGANGKTDLPVGRENWDFDKWQKEDPRGFEALSKSDPDAFKKLYNQKFSK
jgi:ATP-dependent Clp protease protease subunit